jgi:putative membrane protein
MTTFFAFLHHLCAFTLVAALAVEFILVGQVQSETLSPGVARRLLAADAVLGASATLLLIVGLLRVFYFEKGADYYFHSHAFITKLSVFIAVALLSIIPTREFLSWRKALKAGEAPRVAPERLRLVKKIIHGELGAVVIIVLAAAIMARGGWV